MTDFKKGFTAAAAIVTFFCLFQNVYSLRYEDTFLETQLDDWQPSKSSVVRAKPTAGTEPPSLYEPINDSSPNPTERSARQRSRVRNGQSDQQNRRFLDTKDAYNQDNQPKIGTEDAQVVQRNRNGHRQRHSSRVVSEDNGGGLNKLLETSPNARRSNFRNGGEDRNFEIKEQNEKAETQPRRFSGSRNRVQLERRMSLVDQNEPGVSDQDSLIGANHVQRPSATFRGKKHYSDKGTPNLVAERRVQDRSRTKPTLTPIGYNDERQKAYIVLPENQQQQQQTQFNEINQRYQDRSAVHHQRTRQHQNGQYHVEVLPGSTTPDHTRLNSKNSNVIFSSVDYRKPQEQPKTNVVYQYSSQSSSADVNHYNSQPLTDYVLQSPQPNLPEVYSHVTPTVFSVPSLDVSSPLSQLDSTTTRQTLVPGNQHQYRSRQLPRRGESAAKTPIGESASPDFQKPRSQQRRGNAAGLSGTDAQTFSDNKFIEPEMQKNILGRQRRRQNHIRSNQRSGIYTVLPSNMETTTHFGEGLTTTASNTKIRSSDKENQQPRFNSFRNRSRYQTTTTTTTSNPERPNESKRENESSRTEEPEKTTQAPVKPTLRAVTRLIARTTPPKEEEENKPEDDIDITANYPKEFLNKLKVSKEQSSPSRHGQNSVPVPRIQPLPTSTTGEPPTSKTNQQNIDKAGEEQDQTTTQRGRYSQSFYRKLAAKTSYNSGPRDSQKPEEETKPKPSAQKFKPYLHQKTPSKPQQTTPSTATPLGAAEIDEASTTIATQERRKFVPKNKISLEERKHRIELLKEKLRQNATEAENQKLKESLVPQANTHPGSREEPDRPFSHVKTSMTSSVTYNVQKTTDQPSFEANTQTNKYDLITLGSEDNVHVVYFDRNETDRFGSESVSVPVSITPSPSSTTTTSSYDSSSTKEPDFSVLNVTLFPSTRHRFSSRINSTTNLTFPRDVELITARPSPSVLDSPEKFLSPEPSLALSVQNLFNSSPNTSTASVRSPETLSVTQLFDVSTLQTSSPIASTTKRSTTKKKSSGRKKSSKSSGSSTRNRTSTAKGSRRGSTNKAKNSSSKVSTTTVRTSSQRTANNNNNDNNTNNNSTINGVRPLALGLADIESIINETMEVVYSNPMTSPKPATAPRSQLNALTPETFFSGGNGSSTTETATTGTPETTSPMTALTNNGSSTNQTNSRLANDVKCIGESCQNATSQSLHINNDQARQSATTKSPETLRKIFIFGLFPNNTIQRRPFNESAVPRNATRGSGAIRQSTTTTTTTSQPDYDVFGIYPNNSVVRRRGWKTFDHERYMSPYVIFGIYPNNTIVKKYPNGTIIRDEFMISDNEIRNMMPERTAPAGCPCATNNRTSTTTSRTTTTTEGSDGTTVESVTTERNPKNDVESIDLDTITEPQRDDAREINSATTTESTEVTTEKTNEEDKENEEDGGAEEEGENEDEEEEEEVEEELNATTPSDESTTKRLEEIEEIDDASTPKLGIGETTTAANQNGDGTESAREIDGISVSTTAQPDAGLVNAEEADTARIISTTGSFIPGPTEVTDRALPGNYVEKTTTEDTTDKTTTEFYYYRPTEFSPLSLNINEGLVDKLPPKVVTVTPKTVTPKTVKPQSQKPTVQKSNSQNGFGLFPNLRNNLLGNILSNLGLFNQPTPTPKAKPKPVPTTTRLPINPTERPNPKTTTVRPQGTQKQAKSDERFAIDLFGLNAIEGTTEESTTRPPTTNSIPTTTMGHPPSVTSLPHGVDIISKDDLREVQIVEGSRAKAIDGGLGPTTIHGLKESDIFINAIEDPRTTTLGPLEYIQDLNSPTPYAYERVTATPIFGFDSPTERPLTGAGIVSITYDDDLFDSSTPKDSQLFQIGQSTIPTYVQKVTARQALPVTRIPETTNPTQPELDIRKLGNLITKLTTHNNNNGNGRTESAIFGKTEPTTDGFTTETTTSNDYLNSLLPISIEDIRSAVSGNQITKRQRKPTKYLDEPTSLTNIAYKALSSSNEIPLPDIVATTTKTSSPITATTTTTTTTTVTRPKKKKPGPNAPGRIKVKKMKNLSRTSVMAFKNLTETTSTPIPESVYIVTPLAGGEGGNGGFRPAPGESRRPKIKFVTLTPDYVVAEAPETRNSNEYLTMPSQHVQKVTKAPAKLPDNFLSTVYGQIEERASSPIPEILKNVGNDIEGDGLSVSLAKRIITLALEKAISNSTTQETPQTETVTSYPSLPDLPTKPTLWDITTTPKPNPTTKKITETTTKSKPTTKATTTTTTTRATTTTEKAKPIVATTTKRQTPPTATSTTETIVATPKRKISQQLNLEQSVEKLPSFRLNSDSSTVKVPVKLVSTIDPLDELFDRGDSTKPPTTQKVTEDLNELLAGLWDEKSTTRPTTTKPPTTTTEKSATKTQPKTKKVKEDKITLPKKASDSLSESDLKLLEGILSQQGFAGGAQELEQIVQNQIRLAEEVRKASRNFKKKQKTTTTTTQKPISGGLGFLFNLFGSQGPSNPPVLRGNSRKPQKNSQSESYTGLSNTPDPINELDEDFVTADRTARGELVTAAIDVTKAVSKFMGTVLTSAAQSFQTFFRSLRS